MPEEIKIENLDPSPEVVNTPENIQIPEKKVEQIKPQETLNVEKAVPQVAPSVASKSNVAPMPVNQDEIILHKVESILAGGMEKIYLSMDAGTQAIFKAKGEETSQKVASLMMQTKVQIKEVINLIVAWLRIVPQINKYYIEQEAKIKADAIMEIYNKK